MCTVPEAEGDKGGPLALPPCPGSAAGHLLGLQPLGLLLFFLLKMEKCQGCLPEYPASWAVPEVGRRMDGDKRASWWASSQLCSAPLTACLPGQLLDEGASLPLPTNRGGGGGEERTVHLAKVREWVGVNRHIAPSNPLPCTHPPPTLKPAVCCNSACYF